MPYAIAKPNLYIPIHPQPDIPTLISLLSAKFQLATWILTATLPATGSHGAGAGVQLRGTSPQGLAVLLEITAKTIFISSVPNALQWQLKSAIGSGAVGTQMFGFFDPSFAYQLIVFPCGWFFSQPGQQSPATCGGIPYIAELEGTTPAPPSDCELGSTPATEVWWSMAQLGNGLSGSGQNPRHNLDLAYGVGSGPTEQNCGCEAGVVTSGSPDTGVVQILRLSSVADEGFISSISRPVWYDGSDAIYPSFIAWGATTSEATRIRGQLYNATNRSGKYSLDTLNSWDSEDWINYTDNYFFGSLWCLKSGGAQLIIPGSGGGDGGGGGGTTSGQVNNYSFP